MGGRLLVLAGKIGKPIVSKLGTTPQRWTAASINFLTQDEMRRLLDAMPVRLAEHNRLAAPVAQLEIRAIIHAGELVLDGQGGAGEQVNLAFRLLDSEPLRKCLTASTGPLVVGVSDQPIYQQVVRHHHMGLDPTVFEAVARTARTLGYVW